MTQFNVCIGSPEQIYSSKPKANNQVGLFQHFPFYLDENMPMQKQNRISQSPRYMQNANDCVKSKQYKSTAIVNNSRLSTPRSGDRTMCAVFRHG
jgi:hypothetical protein